MACVIGALSTPHPELIVLIRPVLEGLFSDEGHPGNQIPLWQVLDNSCLGTLNQFVEGPAGIACPTENTGKASNVRSDYSFQDSSSTLASGSIPTSLP